VFVPAHLLPAAAHRAHHQRDIQDVAEGRHCGSMEEQMEVKHTGEKEHGRSIDAAHSPRTPPNARANCQKSRTQDVLLVSGLS
jgi:hypothetical protein